MSWLLGNEGRKVFAASSLHDAEGKLCAIARATWIRIASAPSS
jgi:hypothetical protein